MSIQFNTEKNWKIYAGQIISSSNNGDTATAQIDIGQGKIQFTGDFHFTEPDSQTSNRFIKMDNMQLIEFNDIFNDQNIVRDNRLNLRSDFNDVGNHRVNNVLQIKSLFELPRNTILSFNSFQPDTPNTFINLLSLLAKRDPFFDRLITLLKDTESNNYKNNINNSLNELYSLYDYPKEDRIYDYVGNLFFTSEIMFDARNLIFDTTKTNLGNEIDKFNILINDNTGQRNGTLDLLFDYTTLYISNTDTDAISDLEADSNTSLNHILKLYKIMKNSADLKEFYNKVVPNSDLEDSTLLININNIIVLDNLYNFIGKITRPAEYVLREDIYSLRNEFVNVLGNFTMGRDSNGTLNGVLNKAYLLIELSINTVSGKTYLISDKVNLYPFNNSNSNNQFIEINGVYGSDDDTFASYFTEIPLE